MLYKGLNKLIKYAYSKGAAVSIITNGYLINDAWIEENAMYLNVIPYAGVVITVEKITFAQ